MSFFFNMEISNKICHNCGKAFSGNSLLYRHLREVHKLYDRFSIYEKDQCLFKCLEGCNISFRFNRNLRIHLNNSHGFNIIEKVKQFENLQGFQKFRLELQENGAQYIIHGTTVTSKTKGTRITYYACNRSGIYKDKIDVRKRQLKKKGSRKINAGCTSYLKLEENVNDGNLKVYYCDHHYGHKLELEHLPLLYETRSLIVNKLLKGASLVRVDLNEGGNEFDGIQRSDLLTKSDINSLLYISKSMERKLVSSLLKMESNEDDCNENYETDDITEHTEFVNDVECVETETEVEEEHIFCNDNESIETHYVELEQGPSDSKEDEFGCYVAEILKKIDHTDRDAAKEAMDIVLKSYLSG